MIEDNEDTEALPKTPGEILARLEEFMAADEARKRDRLAKLGALVRQNIDKAVSFRKSSGVEEMWKEDEHFYLGADKYNKGLQGFTKSRSTEGVLVENTGDSANTCTRFFNHTAQFVDSATARCGDILLPAGDWNFAVKKTPVPESPVAEVIQDVEDISQGDAPGEGGVPDTQEDDALVDEKVTRGETRIKDWLTETRLHVEQRKVIASAALRGTGILKGPFPAKRTTKRVDNGELIVEEVIVPKSKSIDPDNFFPAPNCGDNIQNGDYVCERSYLTAKQLNDLKGVPGYDDDQIAKVLAEGPKAGSTDKRDLVDNDSSFEVWEYHGMIKASDLDLIDELSPAEQDQQDPEIEESDTEVITREEHEGASDRLVSVVLVLVNKKVIKGHTTPLQNKEFIYDVMVWQARANSPFGIGVARQGRVGQEMINAAARALMDNMSLSSGVILGILDSVVHPVDGSWELTKNKMFRVKESSGVTDIKQAISSFEVPSRQAELVAIIELGHKTMEEATGIPFILQGQQGSAPDTVGGMNLLHQNASALLRRIARGFDENITEPHISRYYDWLLVHGDDDEKGDIMIEAVGSSSLVKREVQALQAQQVLAMAADPAFGLSKAKTIKEVLRAWDFEPSRFEMDKQEVEALQNQEPPEDPRVTVANLKIQADEQMAQMKLQAEQQILQLEQQFEERLAAMKMQVDIKKIEDDTDRDTVHIQAQAARDAQQQRHLMAKLELEHQNKLLERDLMMMKMSVDQGIALDKIKADLSKTAMTLSTQKEMAGMNGGRSEQVANPIVEPLGRAPEGEAFQK